LVWFFLESFLEKEQKKFPPNLRAPLFAAADVAASHSALNDYFFLYLTTILPYNRFTLTKFVKRHRYGLVKTKALEDIETNMKELKSGVEERMKEIYDMEKVGQSTSETGRFRFLFILFNFISLYIFF